MNNTNHELRPGRRPHGCCGPLGAMSRREFFAGMGTAAVGTAVLGPLALRASSGDASGYKPRRLPLLMQPVLTYETPKRREATSWRSWGAIETDAQAAEEKSRIDAELKQLAEKADFPVEFRPTLLCKTAEQAAETIKAGHDGVIIYAAGAWLKVLEKLTDPAKWNVIFVRHRSGPVYLWYEIVHNRYLRKTVDDFGQPGMDVDDVVVDDRADLLWRLRALAGLKNTLGRRIVAVGGAAGWGEGGAQAPRRAAEDWKLEIIPVSYGELGKLLDRAYNDAKLAARAEKEADAYLNDPTVRLETDRLFVHRAFVLTEVLKRIMAAAEADAITVNECMGTIMQVSKTTACLPLSLLNDAGFLAFCESDFVVIPSGILLHSISGRPVFLNDPTYPHHGLVTLAHCTAPRRLDGRNLEKARILTHFESDYGAAPKVEMKVGQVVTNLIPDFSDRKWCGFEGRVAANPFLAICRSQVDVEVKADVQELLREMKGFHWMTCYGSYLRETGYALKRVGVGWLDLTRS